MTSVAPDTEQLHELDAETRQAWTAYSERLRELSGERVRAGRVRVLGGAPGRAAPARA